MATLPQAYLIRKEYAPGGGDGGGDGGNGTPKSKPKPPPVQIPEHGDYGCLRGDDVSPVHPNDPGHDRDSPVSPQSEDSPKHQSHDNKPSPSSVKNKNQPTSSKKLPPKDEPAGAAPIGQGGMFAPPIDDDGDSPKKKQSGESTGSGKHPHKKPDITSPPKTTNKDKDKDKVEQNSCLHTFDNGTEAHTCLIEGL